MPDGHAKYLETHKYGRIWNGMTRVHWMHAHLHHRESIFRIPNLSGDAEYYCILIVHRQNSALSLLTISRDAYN
jgi:hypothetical protein